MSTVAMSLYTSTVSCPQCGYPCAWLGEQGACVDLYGACLTCLLFPEEGQPQRTEEELDTIVEAATYLREARERLTGRRIFPCVNHAEEGATCRHCSGRGWIVGYPPGALPPS